MADVVDEVNKEMYERMKKFFMETLNDIKKLAIIIYQSHNEKQRREALEKIFEEIKKFETEYDKRFQEYMNVNKTISEQEKEKATITGTTQQTWKERLPDSYEKIQNNFVGIMNGHLDKMNDKMEAEMMGMSDKFRDEDKERFIFGKLDGLDVSVGTQKLGEKLGASYYCFNGYEKNNDFAELIDDYLKTYYEDTTIEDFMNEDKSINYYELTRDTDIKEDIFAPLMQDIAQDEKTIQQTQKHLNELKGKHADIDFMLENLGSDSDKMGKAIENVISTDDLLR